MNNISIKRVAGSDGDFIKMVKILDSELEIIDGEDHDFYHQYNTIHDIEHALVLYSQNEPVGCGAIKKYDGQTVEVKRMFVLEKFRGSGLSKLILSELEKWARELEFKKSLLETGKRQTPAVNLYKNTGYNKIPNYGQYAGIENSICFEKML